MDFQTYRHEATQERQRILSPKTNLQVLPQNFLKNRQFLD